MKKLIILMVLLLNLVPYNYDKEKRSLIFGSEIYAQDPPNEYHCPGNPCPDNGVSYCTCGGNTGAICNVCNGRSHWSDGRPDEEPDPYTCPCCELSDGTCGTDWCWTNGCPPEECSGVDPQLCPCCDGTTCSGGWCSYRNRSWDNCTSYTMCVCCGGSGCSADYCNTNKKFVSECSGPGTICPCCNETNCKNGWCSVQKREQSQCDGGEGIWCSCCTRYNCPTPGNCNLCQRCWCGHVGCFDDHVFPCGKVHCEGKCYCPKCVCGHYNCTYSHRSACGQVHCDGNCTCPKCACGHPNCPSTHIMPCGKRHCDDRCDCCLGEKCVICSKLLTSNGNSSCPVCTCICQCCEQPGCKGCCPPCEIQHVQSGESTEDSTETGQSQNSSPPPGDPILTKLKCDGCSVGLHKDPCGNCLMLGATKCTDSIENKLFPPIDPINRFSSKEIKDLRKIIQRVTVHSLREKYFLKLQHKVPYQNQRNNESVIYSNGKRVDGDVMCNVTVMSQCFELLGIENPDTSKQYADYLYKIYKDHPKWNSPEYPATRDSIAKALKVKSVINSCNPMSNRSKQQKIDTIRNCLKKGYGVMLNVYKDGRGHFVRVIAIDSTGIIIDDPYGNCVDPEGRNKLVTDTIKDAKGVPIKCKLDATRDSTTSHYKNDGYIVDGTDHRNTRANKNDEESGSQGLNKKWTWPECNKAILKRFDIYKPENE